MLKVFYLINRDGAQVGVLHAHDENEAINAALYDMKIDDLDHVHQGGSTPSDGCDHCAKIQADIKRKKESDDERRGMLH